ncbi:uncharacterized protein [Physcomitrium patens]|uniref:uncharacterized protein isoform X3 n=1 Tax=Physcomitrium patens TaxID=3218 RepID=UPI003CCCF335
MNPHKLLLGKSCTGRMRTTRMKVVQGTTLLKMTCTRGTTRRGDASNLELIEVGQKNGRESLWIHHSLLVA